MIELNKNKLTFSFPEVHPEASCHMSFQRTFRIPDDNREYNLPPGFGAFPLHHVDDYKDSIPSSWVDHGGVFMPMYQSEAMWINFSASYPMLVKVGVGKIDAVTGGSWSNDLSETEQNYLVIPGQPWLDGFCVGEGLIRQFVAMPLGDGYTAEEQITGKAENGGIQLLVCPMKADIYSMYCSRRLEPEPCMDEFFGHQEKKCSEMGLAPGGLMRQSIYEDKYEITDWQIDNYSRCFVHICNSNQYLSTTGMKPPNEPLTAKQYTEKGIPWFSYYDGDSAVLDGAPKLAGLDSVAAKHLKLGKGVINGNDPAEPLRVIRLGPTESRVREEDF